MVGWQLTAAVNPQTGEIGIDLFGTNPILSTASGSLVTIALEVKVGSGQWAVGSDAMERLSPTTISLVNQVDPTGQRVFTTTVADSQGAFVLQEAATSVHIVVGTLRVPSLPVDYEAPPMVSGHIVVGTLRVPSSPMDNDPPVDGGWLLADNSQWATDDEPWTAAALPTAHCSLPTVSMPAAQNSLIFQPAGQEPDPLDTPDDGNEKLTFTFVFDI